MSRFMNRLRQRVDGLLAPAAPPVPTSDSPLARHYAQLRCLQTSRVQLEHARQTLVERQTRLQHRAANLYQEATIHVQSGHSDLARLLIGQRLTTLAAVEALAKQQQEIDVQITQIVDVEQRMRSLIETINQRRDVITAQQQAAIAQIKVGETLTGLNDRATHGEIAEPFTGIDRSAEDAVESLQAQASAIRRLINDGLLDLHIPDLADTLDIDFSLESTIDSELAAIRQHLSTANG